MDGAKFGERVCGEWFSGVSRFQGLDVKGSGEHCAYVDAIAAEDFAYASAGSVYFSTRAFGDGKGARVDSARLRRECLLTCELGVFVCTLLMPLCSTSWCLLDYGLTRHVLSDKEANRIMYLHALAPAVSETVGLMLTLAP